MKFNSAFKKLLKPFKSLRKNKPVVLLLTILFGYLIFRTTSMCNRVEGFESKPASFNQDVSGGKKLVWFYADWCGHCKNMKKEWDKASQNVDGKMVKINLGNEDSETQKISEKYNIKSFPTILLLNNGEKEAEYEEGRTAKDFESYCSKIH